MWIGQRSARPFGERTACPFLRGPHGIEQRASIVDQGGDGGLVFLAILHVPGNSYFAADILLDGCCAAHQDHRNQEETQAHTPACVWTLRHRLPPFKSQRSESILQ